MADANIIKSLRHPNEQLAGTLMLVFGLLFWVLIGGGIALALANEPFALLPLAIEIVLIVVVLGIMRLLLRAYVYGHYVMVSPQQFPHLHQMVVQGAEEIGLKETPLAFVYNSAGVVNAMALKLIGRRHVWITSAILDCSDDAQIRFVIGHELAHHAAGHLDFWRNLVKFPGHFVPFLGPAYSRARELTCDRMGCYLSHDLAASKSALQLLACGSAKLNGAMNPDAFQAQEQLVPPIAGFFLAIFSHYPRLTQRVTEVSAFFGRPPVVPTMTRN